MKRLLTFVSVGLFAPVLVWAQDPNGAKTLADKPELALDFVWVLICGFLVMFMQLGFAMLEAGGCRAKNVVNLMSKNLIDFVAGSLVFMAAGFALMMGTDHNGLFGTTGWFLAGDSYDVERYKLFFFQLVFATTAATIVSGAVAERLKFKVYLIYSLLVSLVVYPIYGHWVWGGGWLSKLSYGLGHLDFAGSGVVHTLGGVIGLVGAIMLGPRIGRFNGNGGAKRIPPHNITLIALGSFVLWFGWFGFNAGSTLSAHQLRIAVIAVTTTLAGSGGSMAALLLLYWKTKRWNASVAYNGGLAGLVGVTASCAWVQAWSAILIGAIAGVLMVYTNEWLERHRIDDPVGVAGVHLVPGLWGLLAVGLFADGVYGNYTTDAPFVTGLFYGGGTGQLIAQLIGMVTVVAWAALCAFIIFKVMDVWFGIRVSKEEEEMGLDLVEHEGPGYSKFFHPHDCKDERAEYSCS